MRDFTFIDDVTEGIIKLINKPIPDPNFDFTSPNPSTSWARTEFSILVIKRVSH